MSIEEIATFNKMKNSNHLFVNTFLINTLKGLSGVNKERDLPSKIIIFFFFTTCFACTIFFYVSFFYTFFFRVLFDFYVII